MNHLFLALFAIFCLYGCSGMSESMQTSSGVGGVKSTVSGFDKSNEVTMNNAWVANDQGGAAEIGMAFRWQESSPGSVAIVVRIAGSDGYNNITAAALNIDGTIHHLTSIEALTSHNRIKITDPKCSLSLGCVQGFSVKTSDKMFIEDLSLVRNMLSAKTLKIKVESSRKYRVGDLRKDSYGNIDVLDRLPEFIAEVDKGLAK